MSLFNTKGKLAAYHHHRHHTHYQYQWHYGITANTARGNTEASVPWISVSIYTNIVERLGSCSNNYQAISGLISAVILAISLGRNVYTALIARLKSYLSIVSLNFTDMSYYSSFYPCAQDSPTSAHKKEPISLALVNIKLNPSRLVFFSKLIAIKLTDQTSS